MRPDAIAILLICLSLTAYPFSSFAINEGLPNPECIPSYHHLFERDVSVITIPAHSPQDGHVDRYRTEIDNFAKAKGLKPLTEMPEPVFSEDKIEGMRAYVFTASPPRDGRSGKVLIGRGRIERVANHFVSDVIAPRIPKHDGLIIVDDKGERHLLDNPDERTRVFVDPSDRAPIKDTSNVPIAELLKEKGWEEITPQAAHLLANGGEGLVGKELIGYHFHTAGSGSVVDETTQIEVRGVIRSKASHGKWHEWTSALAGHTSPVTGAPPYIAVEVITAHGTDFELSLSIPGKYYVRDLNPAHR